jgi:hypothetical protein
MPLLIAHVNVAAHAVGIGQTLFFNLSYVAQVLKQLEQFSRKRGIRHSTVQICNPSTIPIVGSEDRV